MLKSGFVPKLLLQVVEAISPYNLIDSLYVTVVGKNKSSHRSTAHGDVGKGSCSSVGTTEETH